MVDPRTAGPFGHQAQTGATTRRTAITDEDVSTGPIGVGAKKSTPPAAPKDANLGAQIVAFAVSKSGQRVGDGQCFALADQALKALGARSAADFGTVTAVADYKWGAQVSLADVRPGDIVQFRKFKSTRRDDAEDGWFKEFTKERGDPNHTAIVVSVDGNGLLTVIEQNAPPGSGVHKAQLGFSNTSFQKARPRSRSPPAAPCGSTGRSRSEASVSETAYDSVPYPGHVHTHTHPNRIAAIARLFGIDAPPVSTARVLEIGCGDGGNLISIAYTLPRSQCVGVDLAATAIERGRQHVKALALTNCDLVVADLATVGRSLGEFDYVIAHGVYSWVPPPLRDALLQLISDALAPTGVAFVSYNVFPGWRIAGMVREMLRYHTLGIDDPGARVEQSKALMKFVAVAHDADDPYGRLLAAECERVSGYPPWYLHHDDLADVNDPVYFHEFVAQAQRF